MKNIKNYCLLLVVSFLVSCGTDYVNSRNVTTEDGVLFHKGNIFTGTVVYEEKNWIAKKYLEKGEMASYFENYEDGILVGFEVYDSDGEEGKEIEVENVTYNMGKTLLIETNENYIIGYSDGKVETKVPGYWKDGEMIRHGVGQKFDTDGEVLEEKTFVHGEPQ